MGTKHAERNLYRKTNIGKRQQTKMEFFIQSFFFKQDQIRRFLWIWSHLLKKLLIENFILGAVRDMTAITKQMETIKSSTIIRNPEKCILRVK